MLKLFPTIIGEEGGEGGELLIDPRLFSKSDRFKTGYRTNFTSFMKQLLAFYDMFYIKKTFCTIGKYICYMQAKYVLMLNQYVPGISFLAVCELHNSIICIRLISEKLIRILDSFCAAAKIVLDRASFHTQERFWRRGHVLKIEL